MVIAIHAFNFMMHSSYKRKEIFSSLEMPDKTVTSEKILNRTIDILRKQYDKSGRGNLSINVFKTIQGEPDKPKSPSLTLNRTGRKVISILISLIVDY